MKITSITTGEEFLCIDKGTFDKIIRKLEYSFLKTDKNEEYESNIYDTDFIVFDNKFKDIKNLFKKSKTLLEILKKKLSTSEIKQEVPEDATGQKFLTPEKLIGHSMKCVILQKGILLLEIQRHPFGDHTIKRQYWIFDHLNNVLKLIYVGDRTNICESTGQIKVQINGVWQDPPIEKKFNDNLLKYFGIDGKDFFRSKIACYNDDLIPKINTELKEILGQIGIGKLPDEYFKEVELPYIDRLVKSGKIKGDYLIKTGKKSIESLLFK